MGESDRAGTVYVVGESVDSVTIELVDYRAFIDAEQRREAQQQDSAEGDGEERARLS